MKSSQKYYSEVTLKKSKKENAPDTISKSKFNLKSSIMSTLKNNVQLIGNVGQEPTITQLESGKKVARITLATNENYKDNKGEKQSDTQWHTLVAWGKTAEIVEKYVTKGKEIAIFGKLTSRSYETQEGEKRYVTEVVVNEILLLGTNK
jgi:single-strand DNA-binding protein